MKNIIAERKLFYSIKNKNQLKPFSIKLSKIYKDESKIKGLVCYACDIYFDGLDEIGDTKHGMDSVQALNIATNLEPLLHRLSKVYDLFWEDREPYFDASL